ncbi:MAG: NAD-dependent epimerase/dehydratase family protein [Bacillati bacterium ANGP1]|uniref:NAD-dependent epimerase/dehydratase family protein n=1 Tax=Candidatus Segetimicrobium genomatis TaxID=2569760 RepID=A0A537J112_9BACT|nr:MAG: NAD-dependent epimerase/dehydratase family protein [Terrabacteria group bacterium ANGP1]
MLDGKAPTIFGDGKQTRDFVYVEDVARANLLATTAPTSDMANIGTGTETAINDLYRHLAQLTGFGAQPVYASKRPGEVDRIALDPTRAARWLQWKPADTSARRSTPNRSGISAHAIPTVTRAIVSRSSPRC